MTATCSIDGVVSLAPQSGGRVRCKVAHEAEKKRWRTAARAAGKSLKYDKMKYQRYRGDTCVRCGFKGEPCQMDTDHIDGNHQNHDPANLQTLCANCHRLKTYQQLHDNYLELSR